MLFRQKPVPITAYQLPYVDSSDEECPATMFLIADWCGGDLTTDPTDDNYCIDIPTFEGVMTARPGDWVIQGITGEFYSCRPDIFEATYEPVEDARPLNLAPYAIHPEHTP